MFLGDEYGRSGWTVRLEDGSETFVYFKLPAAIGRTEMLIADAPQGLPVDVLLPQWLDGLEIILADAENRFSGASR